MTSSARRFWDARAREQALYFVDNTLDYADPDLERFWAGGEQAVDAILGALGVTVGPGDELVEIGCGVGRLTRPLAVRAAGVTAVDVSAEMLDRARRLNPGLANVRWLHGNGESLEGVPDASADGCFSHVVFQHLPDAALTLGYVREMARVLRPRGWAAFGVSTDPAVHRPQRSARQRVAALLGRGPRGQSHPAWVGSAVDLAELEAVASDSGLEVKRVLHPRSQFTLVLARRRA